MADRQPQRNLAAPVFAISDSRLSRGHFVSEERPRDSRGRPIHLFVGPRIDTFAVGASCPSCATRRRLQRAVAARRAPPAGHSRNREGGYTIRSIRKSANAVPAWQLRGSGRKTADVFIAER